MNKRQLAMYSAWQMAKHTTLDQAYGRYSKAKADAFNYCRDLQLKLNGHDGRITGASSHFFSYAFKYEQNGREYLCYVTHANNYRFPLE